MYIFSPGRTHVDPLQYIRLHKHICLGDSQFRVVERRYMLVGGLKTEQPDHAARVARFALEAVQAAHTVKVEGVSIKIRCGMNSGPVTSGVVGAKMPRYCLFGDTVRATSTPPPSPLLSSYVVLSLQRSHHRPALHQPTT